MHQPPKPPPRRVRSPLVWAGVGVLAVVLLGASALRFATASCALELAPAAAAARADSPAQATAVTRGEAYFYDPRTGVGSCSFGPLAAGGLYVSLGSAQYAGGSACGSYLDVSGPRGSVRAEVVDECPGCADGGIDMSETAFSRIASPGAGTAQVSYRVVRDPRLPGPVELRMAPSASAAWLAVQVLNNGNPLSSVQVMPAGRGAKARWQSLVLDPDDYWAVADSVGPGPFEFRITDVFGHRIMVGGVRLTPGAVQDTRVLMYDAAVPSSPKTASPATTTAPAPSAPSSPRAAPC